MFVVLMLACSGPPDTHTFLDDIVESWWHLENEDQDIYLEPSHNGTEGVIRYNALGNPHSDPYLNPVGGDWTYLGNKKFEIAEDEVSYTLKIKPENECYKLIINSFSIDTACPYTGSFD